MTVLGSTEHKLMHTTPDGDTITAQRILGEIWFIVDFSDGSQAGFQNWDEAADAAGVVIVEFTEVKED